MTVRVVTSLGVLEGTCEADVAIYRGVPYARPPVGARRFAAPEPAGAWHGVRDASRFAASPPQSAEPLGSMLGLFPEGELGEDCLTLNIFAPARASAPRPVLVWIQGGAFIGGASAVPLYDARRLAARGDVVVVTFDYRVGMLGFSTFDESSETTAVNAGLLDQIAALRFVREHIECFGGDPDRVTVFGESAGAGSLLALFGIDAARGLFHRAIAQSGAPEGVLTLAEGRDRTGGFIDAAGLDPADLDGLRAVPVDRLLAAQQARVAAGPHRTGMFCAPVCDGSTLREVPLTAATTGWARDIDLLIGTTRDEMRLYDSAWLDSDTVLAAVCEAQMTLAPEERAAASAELIAVHREQRRRRGFATAACDLFASIQTEVSLRYPAIRIAEARNGARNTRMYRFDWGSPLHDGIHGACHALDLPFVFGNLDAPGMREFAGTGSAPIALSERMMDAWVAFARTGDPSHDEIGEWPVYEASRRSTLLFDVECRVEDAPFEAERAAMERIGCFDPRPDTR